MSDWPYPRIVAHRGGGLAPENTLAAIDVGARLGHRMIEIDAKLSQDGKSFLLHDDTLERTTNGQGIAGGYPWDDLKRLDAGSWYSSEFEGEPLPLLSGVALRCRHQDLLINIEIKPTTGLEAVTGKAVAEEARILWQGMTPPLLSSFSLAALSAAQEAVPNLPRGLLLDEWRYDWQALATQLGCVAIHINHRVLTAERTAYIKNAGFRVLAYTPNKPERAALLMQWAVDCVCTDAIDLIRPLFGTPANSCPNDHLWTDNGGDQAIDYDA